MMIFANCLVNFDYVLNYAESREVPLTSFINRSTSFVIVVNFRKYLDL